MKTDSKSHAAWPFDLRVFAVLAGLWALCLAVSAFVNIGEMAVVDPIETIFAGIRFSGDDARVVLIVEAGIFAAIAIGVFTHQRWGLLLALCYMVQVVMSHLAFVIAYLPFPTEQINVHAAASQGPMMVLITLYLWVRAYDLIFDPPTVGARPQAMSNARPRSASRANSADIAAMAGGGE